MFLSFFLVFLDSLKLWYSITPIHFELTVTIAIEPVAINSWTQNLLQKAKTFQLHPSITLLHPLITKSPKFSLSWRRIPSVKTGKFPDFSVWKNEYPNSLFPKYNGVGPIWQCLNEQIELITICVNPFWGTLELFLDYTKTATLPTKAEE